ncbi:hypothetical protein G7Y89_g12163 [Cudoniella acicularis]|uniref:Heterokaryon incompatibility domain-containing protein n=1 Tax=Cudoniella acicularis TaxID=354080 RepID=A0A8H4R9M4_9HELO|nr:hypothetical protein G7Y89_g12163 [Cudoniella acicularis]
MAVNVIPKGHPDRAGYLTNLGNWLGRRFERTNSMNDLDRAINFANISVEATPSDHPDRVSRLKDLKQLNNLDSQFKNRAFGDRTEYLAEQVASSTTSETTRPVFAVETPAVEENFSLPTDRQPIESYAEVVKVPSTSSGAAVHPSDLKSSLESDQELYQGSDVSDFASVDSSSLEEPQTSFGRDRNKSLREAAPESSPSQLKQSDSGSQLDNPRSYFDTLRDLKAEIYENSVLNTLRRNSNNLAHYQGPGFELPSRILGDTRGREFGLPEDVGPSDILSFFTTLPTYLSTSIVMNAFAMLECHNVICKVSENLLRLQMANFVKDHITILVVDSSRPNVAEIVPIQVADIIRLQKVFLSVTLRVYRNGTEQSDSLFPTLQEVSAQLSGSCDDFLVTLRLSTHEQNRGIASWYSLVCLLDLAVMAYTATHTDTFDMDTRVESPLYFSTRIEEFADIWGPVWRVNEDTDKNLVRHYDVLNGCIVPWPYDAEIHPKLAKDERLCHWIPKQSPWEILTQVSPEDNTRILSHTSLPALKENIRLLIGAHRHRRRRPPMIWDKCQCSTQVFEEGLRGINRLQQLGANGSYIYVDSRAVSAVGGSHGLTLGGNMTIKRAEGVSFKSVFVESWEKNPKGRNPYLLANRWAVAISLCTLNAERISVYQLLKTPSMSRFIARFRWSDNDRKDRFLNILETGSLDTLCDLWAQNLEWQDELGNVLLNCFQALSFTGYDCNRKEFAALWVSPQPTNSVFPKRVLLMPSEHSWTKFLRDSEVSFTVAVIVEECLRVRFWGQRCGDSKGVSALHTSICINDEIDPFKQLVKREAHAQEKQKCGWDWTWDVSGLKIGACFPLGTNGRLRTIEVLTSSRLLLEWDLVWRNALLEKVGIQRRERANHWEYTELCPVRVRPIPIYLRSSQEAIREDTVGDGGDDSDDDREREQ